MVVLSASAEDASRPYGSFDDEICSVHELSGGGSYSNGSTPRGQPGGPGGGLSTLNAAAALPVFHRTAPAVVGSVAAAAATATAAAAAAGNVNLASSTASLVTSMGAASSMSMGSACASASASTSSLGLGLGLGGVITPLPRSAMQRSSLYELRAAFQELSRALAEMEIAATKRAQVRSEAYIIKFEHEYADLARVKDRAMKRLEALLRAGPGGAPAFAPDSVHAQALGGVLHAVLDIDDELLLLMGTEHGTWEELKRVRGAIQRHLLLLGRELGGEVDKDGAACDPLAPSAIVRSLSSPFGLGASSASGGGGGGASVFSFAPAAVAASMHGAGVGVGRARSSDVCNSKRKAAAAGPGGRNRERSGSPSEEDVFKLRPLEASLPSLGSSGPLSGSGGSCSGGGGGAGGGKEGLTAMPALAAAAAAAAPTPQKPRRPAQLQQQPAAPRGPAGGAAEGRDPESPDTMTTASFASSSSSAFSQLSEYASDEERTVGAGAGGGRNGNGNGSRPSGSVAAAGPASLSASGSAAAAAHRLPAPIAAMNKSVSSDALSGLLNPLPAALTARVREKASFLHHRTLGTHKPLYEAALGARPRYHTTVAAAASASAAAAGAPGRVLGPGGKS